MIENTAGEMVAMATTVQSTSSKMEDLGKRTDQIGSIAGVIKEIADQTNLRALKEQSAASELIAQRVEVIASQSAVNATAMGDAKTSSAQMKRLAVELQEIVARFRV